ncbi:MAG: DNA cytosine methyltransferase [Polaromonas sp.]|nr:DNA cytosine methyltransferase [Polaromonas sp.]
MHSQSDQVLSLFSGAGGFSYGFSMADLKPMCGAEIDKNACSTYEANVGSTCFNVDLSEVAPDLFHDMLGGKEPFAIIGGPPCQGFSTAGTRNAGDPRNRLIFNYFRIVESVRPRWFIFENVEGLLTSGNGQAVSALVREFLRIGYSVRLEKVNLAGFGVAQTRKRVLIIGNRMGVEFFFPQERFSYDSGKAKKRSGKPFAPTLLQAVQGLGKPSARRADNASYASPMADAPYDRLMREGNSAETTTEHFDNTNAEDAQRFGLLSGGQTMKDLPEEYWHDSFRRRAFRRVQDGTPTEKRGGAPSGIKRLHGDLQSLTITGAASREFIHPVENRPLTIRECARIQSFPDRYQFSGNAAGVMQQIGNAVPPMAAVLFAQHLQKLDGEFGSGLQVPPTVTTPRFLGFVLTDSAGMSEALRKTEGLLHGIRQPQFELA